MLSAIRAISLALLLLATCTVAIHESDVGVVDWHQRLIGVPVTSSSATAPVFHRVGGRLTQSFVITATESNVLGALSPVNGTLVWRHAFQPEDRISRFHKHGNTVASLSGPGGATLRSFDVVSGELLLEKHLHPPHSGILAEPNHLGTYIAFGNETNGNPDLFVLTNGHTVNHVVAGNVKWTWTSEDQGSLVTYSNLLVTSESIYAIGLAKSFASYTLHVTTLSPATGEVISTSAIPSSISNGLTDFILLNKPSNQPYLAWIDSSNALKFLELTPLLQKKPSFPKDKLFSKIVDLGLGSHNMFVAVKEDGTGHIMAVNAGYMQSVKEFVGSAYSDSTTESMYAGGFDKNEAPYVARSYWSHTLQLVSYEIYAPHLAGGKGILSGFSFKFETFSHGVISHMAFDAVSPNQYQVIGRVVLTTSTGSVQLWQQDNPQWNREEGLSTINAVQFVELPEKLVDSSGRGEKEGFAGRLSRQLRDAKDFHKYLMRFIKRFATGSYESATSSAAAHTTTSGGLPSRDTFGFRQLIILATAHGKIYGMDTSNGKILWSRILGLGSRGAGGDKIVPIENKMFVMRTVGDVNGDAKVSGPSVPEVVVIGQRILKDGSTDGTLLYHFDALTGADPKKPKKTALVGLLQGSEAADSVVDAYFLNAEDKGKVIVILDSDMKVHLYPDTPASRSLFSSYSSSFAVPVRLPSAAQGQYRIVGHQFAAATGISKKPDFSAYPIWTLSLSEGEDIQSIIPSTRGPVASLGKVLGNRTTLYKYLNQRLFIALTEPHSRSSAATSPSKASCGLYLVDSIKGTVVYQTKLPILSATGSCDVKATLTENWLVYHYYDDDFQGTGQAKGYRIVSVELYEGKQPDEKIRSSDMTSYSDKNLDIAVYAQSFVYLHGVNAIATTSTKFGITSKDLIVANTNNKIHSLSHRFLNPRRPVGRKPTSEEMEELIQYDPLLPDDARRVISHKYQVLNIRHIITSPALLESTSLVFAHGLDLFLTRVAPSNTFDVLNENFNKTQLILTILGLAVAILVTKPMVQRKRLREKWYQ